MKKNKLTPNAFFSAITGIFILSVVCFFCLIFAVSSYAHSGDTDSKGGHYNRSTGDYHYHHGYPEHYHYDINNDGKLDCPYTFEENEKTTDKSKSEKNPSKEASTIVEILFAIPFIILPYAGAGFFCYALLRLILDNILENKLNLSKDTTTKFYNIFNVIYLICLIIISIFSIKNEFF